MSRDLLPVFEEFMKTVDKDSDQRLSEEELDQACANASLHSEAYPLLCALKRNFDAVQKLSIDDGAREKGISAKDIAELDRIRKLTKKGTKLSDDKYDETQTAIVVTPLCDLLVVKPGCSYSRTETAKRVGDVKEAVDKMVDSTSRELFAAKDSLKSIKPEAVIQGPNMANCYFMSAVASLAATKPGAIRDMIQQNKDGTFTVSFPGADKKITVSAPTDSERYLFAQGSPHGIWPQVLEKAYGQLTDTWYNPWGGGLPQEATNSGSSLHHGLRMMSGKWVRKWENTMFSSYSSMDKRLGECFENGTPVTAYIKRDPLAMIGLASTVTSDGFQTGHEFGVVGYKANSANPSEALITVYDPQKKESKTITLARFFDNFSGLAFPDR